MSSSTTMHETETVDGVTYSYLTGFGNELSSECLPGALPKARNTPRLVPYNLYTEQLSGSAFTAPRNHTKRTWLYRIQPSVAVNTTNNNHDADAVNNNNTRLNQYLGSGSCHPNECRPVVDALRWKPPQPTTTSNNKDFWDSLQLQCHAGDPATKCGLAIYQYAASAAGTSEWPADRHYCNADGDFLIVPSQGTLVITTELGRLTVAPQEIAVVPRGMVYSVASSCPCASTTSTIIGYVLEIYSMTGFQLPELGPIGSNGLANPRDFWHPTASCVATTQSDYHQPHTIVTKQHSQLFSRTIDHSPYNVVAWHGNYLPYKYHLGKFCAVNSVTYDHLDPSLYTVLTCPSSAAAGTALADFVIFPPRVLATDSNTLRPPWFHRNVMSEYMGLVQGQYDAKADGFVPGGSSLHNCLTPHGPDATSYEKAVADPCEQPTRLNGGLAFMFETYLSLGVTERALTVDNGWRDVQYTQCWQALSADQFEGWALLEEQQQQQQIRKEQDKEPREND